MYARSWPKETHDMCKDTDLKFIPSAPGHLFKYSWRTFRISSALRCKAINFSGLTTGILWWIQSAHTKWQGWYRFVKILLKHSCCHLWKLWFINTQWDSLLCHKLPYPPPSIMRDANTVKNIKIQWVFTGKNTPIGNLVHCLHGAKNKLFLMKQWRNSSQASQCESVGWEIASGWMISGHSLVSVRGDRLEETLLRHGVA